MRGTFITFEGVEGSGKSTQIVLLANYLKTLGKPVTLTREPGGTPIGDQVRRILLDPANKTLGPDAELLLYAASRAQHLREVILPALEKGGIVLCDRFSDATLAYQGYGRGLDREMIRELDRLVTRGMRPDRTILFNIDAAAGLARARGRNDNLGLQSEARFELEETAFHERVRQGYLTLSKEEPGRFIILDGSPAPDEVQRSVWEALADILGMPD